MGSAINPVVSGLLHGFGIASQVNREKDAQRQIALQEKREQDEQSIRDLQTQLALGDRGYKPSTPDQDAELATGFKKDGNVQMPGVIGGLNVPTPTDLKQAKYKGQTYVRSDSAEFEKRLQETGALADVNTQAAVNRSQRMLDTNGISISDEMAKTLNLKPGQKVPPEKIDDLMRGYSNAKAAERAATPHAVGVAREVTDDAGNATSVQTYSDGTVKKTALGPIGKKTQPRRAAGSLTDYQAVQIKRQQVADAAKVEADRVKAQTSAQKEVDTLNKQEQLLHAENREIGARLLAGSAGSATNKQGKKVTVTPGDAAALKAKLADNQTKVKALQDRQHGIIMKFAGAPANDPFGIR